MTEKGFFNGVNRLEVPATIAAGKPFDVTITVGSIPHIMEVAHHIQ